MRILWVKLGGLWPTTSGGRLRSFHLVSELARHHELQVLTTHEAADEVEGLRANLPAGTSVTSVPHVPAKQGAARLAGLAARSWLAGLPLDVFRWRVPALCAAARQALESGTIDLCIADFLVATGNLPAVSATPTVLFEHNVEFLILQRRARVERPGWGRLVLEMEWRRMRRFEARACRRATRTLAVSEADRALLARLAPSADLAVIPTGVDTSYFSPSREVEVPGSIVFTGSMDWFPNEDAICHFVEAIQPEVRRTFPSATLTVVGRNPGPRLRALAAAGHVTVTGTVPDVRPHIARASVYVVPLRVGGGTRLKIFEALAMGKAVVSTTVGAEGLPLTPGEHFLQEDDPARFAAAVVDLLRDSERRRALGAAGRRLVEERYSWPQVASLFARHCEDVVARERSRTSRVSSAPAEHRSCA